MTDHHPPAPPARPLEGSARPPLRGVTARIPLICGFDDRRVLDVAELARGQHLRIVHDGKRLLLTPIVLPGQFVVAEAA